MEVLYRSNDCYEILSMIGFVPFGAHDQPVKPVASQ